MDPLRVGVVGVGVMGSGYARVLDANPTTEVTALAASRPGRAQTLAEELTHARAFDSWPELIASGEVDAVCIATPDHLHTEIMVAAAEAGLHIACEKPFTTSLAEADRAIEAIHRNGVTAMTLFNHRWVPAYAQAKDAIAAGDIGRPVLAAARKNDRIYVPTEMLSWASESTSAWFLSSHDIDLACWFLDDTITHVSAIATSGVLTARGVTTPDAIHIQARFSRGAIAAFESAWIYPNTFPTMVDSFVEVVGSDGVIHLDRQAEQIEMATGTAHNYPRNTITVNLHGRLTGAGPAALLHWAECAATGAEPLVSLDSSRHVTAVLDAAHRAIGTGHEVAVD
jgi:predicted dehydrogenase